MNKNIFYKLSSFLLLVSFTVHGQANDTPTLSCWGRYDSGQTKVPAGTFQQVSAGTFHTCAVKADKTLACWGDNRFGQTNAPAGTFQQVSAGGYHTCTVKADKTLACWGDNIFGQTNAPVGTFQQVSSGSHHTCAVKADNTLACWGANHLGQTNVPVGTFQQVSAGGGHTCAVKTDNTLACWGYNYSGQTNVPVGTFQQVSAGGNHTCAVKTDNTLACWGWNSHGETNAPAGTFQQVSAGNSHTCAVKADNTLACWGYDDYGQTKVPVGIFQQVSAGDSHSCAIKKLLPSSLYVTSLSPTVMRLSWKDSASGEKGFRIQRKTGVCGSTNAWATVLDVSANSGSAWDIPVTPNTTYSYQIAKYYGDQIFSPYSACVSATSAVAGTPMAPNNVYIPENSAASQSNSQVNLRWNDASNNESRFDIYRKADAGNWTLLKSLAANVQGYSDTAATGNMNSTNYSYAVGACNAKGCSRLFQTPMTVPFSPANLAATVGTSIQLTWKDNSSNETAFQVQRKNGDCASANFWSYRATISANKQAFNDANVVSGETYSYKIRSVAKTAAQPYGFGYSNFSNCVSVTAP